MHYHPDIAAALAQGQAADLRDAAAHARRNDREEQTYPMAERQPTAGSMQLDAYPRLCGLPVTIERLPTNGATAHRTSREPIASNSSIHRNPNASGRAKRTRRQRVRLSWFRVRNG